MRSPADAAAAVSDLAGQLPPSLDDFEALAREAWEALPAAFRQRAGDLVIRIEDFAEEEVLAELGLDNPFLLTGLYAGVDLTRRSAADPIFHGAMVFLYRRPILEEWAERGDVALGDLVAHVLVHEVGHHFGLSDEAIDALLAAAE